MLSRSEIRFCSWTWPFPFGVRLGWASAWARNPDWHTAPARVYLLRGNGIFFSRGFGRLCGRLRRMGIWAEDLRCVGDRWMLRQFLAHSRTGRLRGPLILVGHSCGGRYSLFAARRLQELGIPVDLLICIDVAMPIVVPANVRRAVNVYLTRRRIYPARPLQATPGAATVIENIDLNAADSPVSASWLCHLTITDSTGVQSLVLDRILQTARANQSPQAA